MTNCIERDSEQDVKDALDLLDLYVEVSRCCGGRIVQDGYSCPHCSSDAPEEVCFSHNVIKFEELFDIWAERKDHKLLGMPSYDSLKNMRVSKKKPLKVLCEGGYLEFTTKTEALNWVKACDKFESGE